LKGLYEFFQGGVAFIFSTCIQVEKLTPHFPHPALSAPKGPLRSLRLERSPEVKRMRILQGAAGVKHFSVWKKFVMCP
jgi:hypothetical protein